MARHLAAATLILVYLLFCLWTALRHRRRQAAARLPQGSAASWLVVHASQTGHAQQLAEQSRAVLSRAGFSVDACSLAQLDVASLARYAQVLFLVSTTGEGDAPDAAAAFVRHSLARPAQLAGLRYALLALGDRSYAQYCAFGRQLDDWLRHSGAEALFERIEVDNGDGAALRHWQYQLGAISGQTDLPDWDRPSYQRWQLQARACLNPAGCAGPVFHLRLQALEGQPDWRSGDIAEIGPRLPLAAVHGFLDQLHWPAASRSADCLAALAECLLPQDEAELAPLRDLGLDGLLAVLPRLPHREYSIASLPESGGLELLVRQARGRDGRLGHGSGWLTEHLAVGGELALRLRANPNFWLPDEDRPLILIANGTGIAGLRAHLAARLARGQHRNWLLFGERQRAHDFHFGEQLQAWLAEGRLSHLDTVFSRDGGAARYVQDVLGAELARLDAWLAEGAAVYVCGSAQGMAPAVHAILMARLGQDGMDALIAAGRYRRDIY